jgi:hypothetical protein
MLMVPWVAGSSPALFTLNIYKEVAQLVEQRIMVF